MALKLGIRKIIIKYTLVQVTCLSTIVPEKNCQIQNSDSTFPAIQDIRLKGSHVYSMTLLSVYPDTWGWAKDNAHFFLFLGVSKLYAKGKSQAPQDTVLVIASGSSLTHTGSFWQVEGQTQARVNQMQRAT